MPTVKELKAELKKLGLPTDGKKADLEARLMDSLDAKPVPPDAIGKTKSFLQAKREYAKVQAYNFNKKFPR